MFYVGKGKFDKREPLKRAFTKDRKNKWWQRIAANGYDVEIMCLCDNNARACAKEIEFIKLYGRRSLGAGTLVNLTDGGDGGTTQCYLSTRKKLSEAAKKPRSTAWVKSISLSQKRRGNNGVVKKGDKLSKSWRDNIAAKKFGENNPMFGKFGALHPNSRQVKCLLTGLIYDSVTLAAEARGVLMKTLYNGLSGARPNHYNMEFYNG